MNRHSYKEWLVEYGPLVLILALFFLVLLCSGCGTTSAIKEAKGPIDGLLSSGGGEDAGQDPFSSAAAGMTRVGVLIIAGGLVYGALTRFTSGWGLSLAAAGILMILLAWTFSQPWLPWMGLITLLAYGGYKVWNRMNPNIETESILK
jgi:hypothetical protein